MTADPRDDTRAIDDAGNGEPDASRGSPDVSPTDADAAGPEVSIDHVLRGRSGKVQLVVHVGDIAFADKLDVTDAEGREKLIKHLVDKFPGLCRDEIEDELCRIGADVAEQVMEGTASGAADGDEGATADGGDNDVLVNIAKKDSVLFHAGKRHDAEAYATIKVDSHIESWPVLSTGFAHWLRHKFYMMCNRPPAAQAFTDAINTIASIAIFEGANTPVYLRLAEHGGLIYLDLADDDWSVVCISPQKWELIESTQCPVRFIRRRGMQALPVPVRGGSVDELRPFVNCPTDELWTLYIGSLPALYRPRGPYIVSAFSGEQGSAKTSTVRRTRALVDPNKAPLRRLPREERDLMIAANNAYVLAFDNLSTIPPSISDAICSIATGGGFGARELYSDAEEKLIDVMRPVFLNGIEDVATRADILDRSIVFGLPPMEESRRKEDAELDRDFEVARPRILGALLDAVSTALREFPTVKLKRKPRMIDFARWCSAAESAFGWAPGTFVDAYMRNRGDAVVLAIEASAVGPLLLRFMEGQQTWRGPARELLDALEELADDKTTDRKDWPKTPKAMSDALKRIAPALRTLGIDSKIGLRNPGGNRERAIELRKIAPPSPDDSSGANKGADRDTHAETDLGSSDDDRPGKTPSARPPVGGRDVGDGWDSRVGTTSESDIDPQKPPQSEMDRRSALGDLPLRQSLHRQPASENEHEIGDDPDRDAGTSDASVATRPSQTSQPSREGSGDIQKPLFPGRSRDDNGPNGTVDPVLEDVEWA